RTRGSLHQVPRGAGRAAIPPPLGRPLHTGPELPEHLLSRQRGRTWTLVVFDDAHAVRRVVRQGGLPRLQPRRQVLPLRASPGPKRVRSESEPGQARGGRVAGSIALPRGRSRRASAPFDQLRNLPVIEVPRGGGGRGFPDVDGAWVGASIEQQGGG